MEEIVPYTYGQQQIYIYVHRYVYMYIYVLHNFMFISILLQDFACKK